MRGIFYLKSISQLARQLLEAVGRGRIAARDVERLTGDQSLDAVMLELIETAAAYSLPAISGYRVGAVGLGTSGALYLGCNIEFEGAELGRAVHAEQSVVANAAAHGETGLMRVAVSAPPCGHCRQFLKELASAESLRIHLPGRASAPLSELLPDAFGPSDLGIVGGMLSSQNHGFSADHDDLANAAIMAANASYAPYSKAPGGAAIAFQDETVFAGSYLENAAFNPSLPPFQSAFVQAILARLTASEMTSVTIAQKADSRIDHHGFALELLRRIAPRASVRLITR